MNSGYNVRKDLHSKQILANNFILCLNSHSSTLILTFTPSREKSMEYGKPKSIFIVDDDPFMLESLKDYLTREVPHKISVFATGEECLKHIAEKPDIVILDYFLDALSKDAASGMEILKTIKKHYPRLPVIILSSQEKYAVAMQTIQKGADQYVVKDKLAFEKIDSLIKELN